MRYRLIVIHDGTDVGAWPTVGIESRLFLIAEVVVHAHVVADLVSNNLSKNQGCQFKNIKRPNFWQTVSKMAKLQPWQKWSFITVSYK